MNTSNSYPASIRATLAFVQCVTSCIILGSYGQNGVYAASSLPINNGSITTTTTPCGTPAECWTVAEELQVTGTQESFVESTVMLRTALDDMAGNDTDTMGLLWASYGKLNLFYTLNWQIAKDAIDTSLALSETNINTNLFAGWLYSTTQYRDVGTAATYFERAIELTLTDNPTNFWPYFEYAVFLSHIAEDYVESQRMFQVAIDASSLGNPFIAFFYGLLLKYHGDEIDIGTTQRGIVDGEQWIESAIQLAAETGALPGQAAWNMVFQGILLDSSTSDRIEEAKRCCEFSAKILDPNVSNWYVLCPSIMNGDSDHDTEDDIESSTVLPTDIEANGSTATRTGALSTLVSGLVATVFIGWQ